MNSVLGFLSVAVIVWLVSEVVCRLLRLLPLPQFLWRRFDDSGNIPGWATLLWPRLHWCWEYDVDLFEADGRGPNMPCRCFGNEHHQLMMRKHEKEESTKVVGWC